MKKRSLIIFTLLFLIAFGIIYRFIYSAFPAYSQQGAAIWLDSRHYPYEDFFLQMAYPEDMPNIEAKENILTQIRQELVFRSAPKGFDKAWVTQGPGNIGARVNSIVVHPDNELIMYAGFSNGGVFKSLDEGSNWFPIFDEQNFLAIGDIALDPNDPEVVYVGTGDPNISGFPSIGDGLYRSRNGGLEWEFLGLRDQRIISKVLIDPNNSNIIYVATMGLPFERNRARGLYKSVNGGQSWEQVLFISEQTGVIDLLINPINSQILYAAGWDRIRNNRESMVRGEGARIFKTVDGGQTWEMLEGGLPNGIHTRIGLAMSDNNPNLIYAVYVDNDLKEPCSNTGYNLQAIYKTTDSGLQWDTIPTSFTKNGLPCNALGGFGWYFGKIRVNPQNDNDLFLLGVDLWRTLDGGNNWFSATPSRQELNVHADKHDLVFTKDNNIVLATDGGLYKADPNNQNWRDLENIPATQFYRVGYNPHLSELYYGGAQDNGTTGGNANGINNWRRIYGADGFQPIFHPHDPNKFYVETQRGGIRVTRNGGVWFENGTIGIEGNDSRNWDMPYIMSSHDPDILYSGTDKVYRSVSDTIPFWIAISENLSDPSNAYRDHNISALTESPINASLLYASTSDARVWRTNDAGVNWDLISDELPVRYVSDVSASPYFEDYIYVSHSGYKDNDNTPLIHRSKNRGNDWESISGDLPPIAINELLILPEKADSIIFAATDAGVFATKNGGTNWHRLGNNLPLISVYDLVWNEIKNELVAATFARSIVSYSLDSLGLTETINTFTNSPTSDPFKVSLAPNPTKGSFSVSIAELKHQEIIELTILDLSGRILQKERLRSKVLKNKYFDLSAYPKGVYFLKIETRTQAGIKKLMLQ